MADERRIWINSCGGYVEDSTSILGGAGLGMAAAATTLNASGLGAAPALASDEHFVIVFDPDGLTGIPFAKRCTDHASGASSATIEAGALTAEGLGTVRDIPQGTPWVAGCVIKEDMAAPAISRALAAPANVTTAPGATSTISDFAISVPAGVLRGRWVRAWFFTTVYGVSGTGSAAGNLQWRDVEGSATLGDSRWHTNSVTRQMEVGVYGELWVPAGTTRTLRIHNANDGGSSQSVESRDARSNLTYEDR